MKRIAETIILGVLLLSGCAHTAYLGLHGKSIRSFPEIHEAAFSDTECLACHHPEDATGPPTPHPGFTGCLKCHND